MLLVLNQMQQWIQPIICYFTVVSSREVRNLFGTVERWEEVSILKIKQCFPVAKDLRY